MFRKGKISVYFNNTSILRAICKSIRAADKVVGCVAWLTNPKILDALEEKNSEIIMTKHKANRWKRHIKVKFIGSGRGRKKILMHHKFAVLFKKNKPAIVITGSYNWTKSATRHHENIMIIHDEDVADAFYEEFLKLKKM